MTANGDATTTEPGNGPAPGTDADLTAADIAWDLDTLLDGQPTSTTLLDRADELADGARRGTRAPSASSTPTALAAAMHRSAELQEAAGPGRLLRHAALLGEHRRPRAGRAHDAGPGARPRRWPPSWSSSSWSGPRSTSEHVEALLADPRAGLLRPPPALHAPLPRPPAHRARGAAADREVRQRRERPGCACSTSRPRPSPSTCPAALVGGESDEPTTVAARGRACRCCSTPTATCAAPRPHAVTAGLEPGLRTRGFIFNTLLLDKSVDDRLRQLPDLDLGAEPVQRGLRRVRRRPWSTPSWPATTSPSGGTRSRPRCSAWTVWPTTTAWRRWPRTRSTIGWDEARDLVLDAYAQLLAGAGRRRPAVLRRAAGSTPRPAPASGPVRSAPTPCPRTTRTCCSTGPAATATSLTLAHELGHGLHAYLAREQGVFHQSTPLTLAETASVFGEAVTNNALLGPARRPRRSASPCWPPRSRTRSPRCSARWP